jgi:hypothetical protein
VRHLTREVSDPTRCSVVAQRPTERSIACSTIRRSASVACRYVPSWFWIRRVLFGW